MYGSKLKIKNWTFRKIIATALRLKNHYTDNANPSCIQRTRLKFDFLYMAAMTLLTEFGR